MIPLKRLSEASRLTRSSAFCAGDIRGFANLARFHLQGAFEIADALLVGDGPNGEDVEQLLAQLEVGLPAEAMVLLQLPIRLPRGAYLALHRAGYLRPNEVLGLPKEKLVTLVGDATAQPLARLASLSVPVDSTIRVQLPRLSHCRFPIYLIPSVLKFPTQRLTPCTSGIEVDVNDTHVVRWYFNFVLQQGSNPIPPKPCHEVTKLQNNVLSSARPFFRFRFSSAHIVRSE